MKQDDVLRRFVFEGFGVRGEWVRLEHSWQAARQHQQDNTFLQQQLGEALAAVVLLSATIKYTGSLILQIQGKGALQSLVAQSTHDRQIRGLVRGDADIQSGVLMDLIGEGYLVMTIQSEGAEPYQGIVPINGHKLADVVENYFVHSEQLQTRLWLFANQTHAVGLFLQELPQQTLYKDDWARIEMLANTVTEQELLNLPCEEILYRLFNEDPVTIYDPEAVSFVCSCSAHKIEQTLFAMGRPELEAILQEQAIISVDCEFCGCHYSFDAVDIERLLITGVSEAPMLNSRH